MISRIPELSVAQHAQQINRSFGAMYGVAYDVWRRKFIAAAWLCGASHQQLAVMFGVARQTIANHVGRELPSSGRVQLRLKNPPIEFNRLSLYKDFYYALVERDPKLVTTMDALSVAHMLVGMPNEPQEPAGSAYSGEVLDRRVEP